MTPDRESILRLLAAQPSPGLPVSVGGIAIGCAISRTDAVAQLAALEHIGLVAWVPYGWYATERGRLAP